MDAQKIGFLNMASASDSSGNSTPSSAGPGTPGTSPPSSPALSSQSAMPFNKSGTHSGPKFKLINEGDIQLCRLNHTRTIVSKIMNSKYLRRWESHHLILADSEILSSTVSVLLSFCFQIKLLFTKSFVDAISSQKLYITFPSMIMMNCIYKLLCYACQI